MLSYVLLEPKGAFLPKVAEARIASRWRAGFLLRCRLPFVEESMMVNRPRRHSLIPMNSLKTNIFINQPQHRDNLQYRQRSVSILLGGSTG